MPLPNAKPLPASNAIPLESHAASTLRYIRQSMDAATGFAVPGSAGLAMGTVGLAASALSLVPGLAPRWLTIWLSAAAVAAVVGGLLVVRPASVRSLLSNGTPLRRLALCLLPSLFAGAILTAVLNAHGASSAIPGTWLVLYGCALIPASVATRPVIAVMGASFLALGGVAYLLPLHAQMLVLGAGFGGVHLLFGVLLSRESHGRQA